MGIDIEPGCETGPCFSTVLIDEKNTIHTQMKVPLHRLIRLIWEYKPSILATDNIFEIAPSHYDLIRILSLLPDDLKIVQVTRQPNGEYIDIRELAKKEKIELKSGKPSSLQTAYLVALLASRGYGSIVKFVDEKTRIIVTRSRQAKQGGMSRARHQRRIRTRILRTTKEIRKLLDRSKLDYDLLFRKSSGGLESATFTVYAPKNKVREIIREYKDHDIKVLLKPVYTNKVLFEPAKQVSRQKPYIIVGIDPGISTGVAAITLDGKLVIVQSRRGMDRADVINIITEHGTPVLIAADVKPAPEFVKKVAAMLNVPIFEPSVQLSAAEKRHLVEEYVKNQKINNINDPHTRDALAAAIKALNSLSPKFKQIESYLDRIGIPSLDRESVKVLVVKGATIAEALEEAIKKTLQRGSIQQRVAKIDIVKQKTNYNFQKKFIDEIEKLRAENIALRKRLKEAEENIKRLEHENKLFKLELNEHIERDRKIYTLMH